MVKIPPLTPEQIAQVNVMVLTMSVRDVATYFKKDPAAIYRAVTVDVDFVKPTVKRRTFTAEEKADMVNRIRNKTATRPQIVAETGINYASLSLILETAGVISNAPNKKPKKETPVRKTYINLEARYSGLSDGMF